MWEHGGAGHDVEPRNCAALGVTREGLADQGVRADRHRPGGRPRKRRAVCPRGDDRVADRAVTENRCHQTGIATGEVEESRPAARSASWALCACVFVYTAKLEKVQPEALKPCLGVPNRHVGP